MLPVGVTYVKRDCAHFDPFFDMDLWIYATGRRQFLQRDRI